MKAYRLNPVSAKNAGDAREWAVANFYHIDRAAHDAGAYDVDSDINAGELHISVKSSNFTLMSGALCEGLESFDDIWALYRSRVHSNRFVYVTEDFTAYDMDIDEFERFIYSFCRTERESEKNGGAMKIRCRKESGKMLKWLAAALAA